MVLANHLTPLMSSARGDWQTPDCVLERVRKVAPIGLDPCTSPENPCGADYCSTPLLGGDGLLADWTAFHAPGRLVYCNPPYGRGIGAWVEKCHDEYMRGGEVIALLPARTDTRWFPWDAVAICFWRGRLTFKGAPAPAPFPSAVVYWGQRYWAFNDAFCDVGKIVSP